MLHSLQGGAIFNDATTGTAVVALICSTFSGNTVNTNLGTSTLFNEGAGASLQIGGTILEASTFQPSITNNSGNFTSLGHNLTTDRSSTVFTNSTDLLNTNPKLGPIGNNGGLTPTLAPTWGSPAIDKGFSFGLRTDRRGVRRPYDFPSITNAPGGDGSDIGAVEFIPPPPTLFITAPTNSIQLQGAGLSNLTYTILANTDLNTTNWLLIGSALANTAGTFSFTDTDAPGFPMRFYRAVSMKRPGVMNKVGKPFMSLPVAS